MTRLRVAVLASGGGTNLQALLDACGPESPAEIVLVLYTPGAGAAERAHAAGVPAEPVDDPADGAALRAHLAAHRVAFVVLAGYLKLVPADVVQEFGGRMINIHPALLPAFGGPGMYGLRVHAAVLAGGATTSGATVHLVTEDYDRGAILGQAVVPVAPGDTPEALRDRVRAAEHRLLPAAVMAAARHGGRAVPFTAEPA